MVFFKWWTREEISNDNLLEFDVWRHHRTHPYKAITSSVAVRGIGQFDFTFVWKGVKHYEKKWYPR